MCLSRIDATYDKPSDLIVDGWKEFGGTAAAPKSYNFAYGIKLDQWIRATELSVPKDIAASDGKLYRVGFHAYAEERDIWASRTKFRRVYLRRITCAGDQDGKKCVIAQEMYVPSDPNGWPPLPPRLKPRKKLMDRIRKP